MTVYCDCDCKHQENGKCENIWPIGIAAISISENYMGQPDKYKEA